MPSGTGCGCMASPLARPPGAWEEGVGGVRLGQVKRMVCVGNGDSAVQLKFMCCTRSVNPSLLPPIGRAGQRWRTERRASWNPRPPLLLLWCSDLQYAQAAGKCPVTHPWESTVKIEQKKQWRQWWLGHPALINPHSWDLHIALWVWRWIFG